MRKIILGVAVTLDNFIEGPNGEYDWCFTDQDYGMKQFMDRIDSIFYGRKSYEMMMKSFEENSTNNPFQSKRSYVFSNTKKTMVDAEVISTDFVESVNQLKNNEGKDIWLFGGAVLTGSLLKAQLVDELWLSVHPILLGSGKLLFSGVNERIKLKLLDSKSYSSGLVSLNYTIEY
jgi:dihydrofolate reductase